MEARGKFVEARDEADAYINRQIAMEGRLIEISLYVLPGNEAEVLGKIKRAISTFPATALLVVKD